MIALPSDIRILSVPDASPCLRYAEEELICWSEASLRAPLNETGFQRYSELFRLVFPEESERLNIV